MATTFQEAVTKVGVAVLRWATEHLGISLLFPPRAIEQLGERVKIPEDGRLRKAYASFPATPIGEALGRVFVSRGNRVSLHARSQSEFRLATKVSKIMPLLLLDRDNVVVSMPKGARYLYGEDAISLVPGAAALIHWANSAGIPVGIVTNQRGIALTSYPKMTEATVARFHERLRDVLLNAGARIDAFYICPHDASDNCDCRKPRPGLILQAMKDFGSAKQDVVLVGDNVTDVEAAKNAGVSGVLFRNDERSLLTSDDVLAFGSLNEIRKHLKQLWR